VSDILLFTSAEPSEFPFFNGKIGNVYAMYMCITFTCSCASHLHVHVHLICFLFSRVKMFCIIRQDNRRRACTRAVKARLGLLISQDL